MVHCAVNIVSADLIPRFAFLSGIPTSLLSIVLSREIHNSSHMGHEATADLCAFTMVSTSKSSLPWGFAMSGSSRENQPGEDIV